MLIHPVGEKALFHPRYLDFAACYGFEPRACNVRKANEKGRVENAVGYVKKNFLSGLQLPNSLSALNTAARQWMDQIANVRIHGETRKQPIELFTQEQGRLKPLPPLPADTGVVRTVRATNRCRVVLDTNRYSVPSLYASQRLTLKTFADRLCIYHAHNLIATHPRSYERHRDFENPDHLKDLLAQRRRAREATLLLAFYALSPRAEEYSRRLERNAASTLAPTLPKSSLSPTSTDKTKSPAPSKTPLSSKPSPANTSPTSSNSASGLPRSPAPYISPAAATSWKSNWALPT